MIRVISRCLFVLCCREKVDIIDERNRLMEIEEGQKLSEDELEAQVKALLWDVLVLGHSETFGLQWRTGSTEFFNSLVGGWLNKVEGSKKLFFYIVDDENGELVKNKSEQIVGKTQRIKFSDINYIHVSVKETPRYSVSFNIETENESWELAPVQDDDVEVVASWVACLRHRGKLYSDDLLLAHSKALKAVISIQTNFRRRKAYHKYKRRKKRREGIGNVLASTVNAWLYGGDGYFDTDSEDEDAGEGDNKMRVKTTKKKPETSDEGGVFMSLVSVVMSDMYNQAFGIKDKDGANLPRRASGASSRSLETGDTKKTGGSLDLFGSKFGGLTLSKAGRIQTKYLNKPADPDEIEDEVWELEKWEIAGKNWKPMGYSDRLNLVKAKVREECLIYEPDDWIVTLPFELDRSGLTDRTCGKNGWVYASSMRKLILEKSLGKVHIAPSASTTVRRRRWFQRRKRQFDEDKHSKTSNKVVWHGYLAMKTDMGRWQPYYSCLTSGLVRDGKMTGIALIQFKHKVKNFMEYVTTNDMSTWDQLRTGKHINIYILEGAQIVKGLKQKGDKKGDPRQKNEPEKEFKSAKYGLKVQLTGFSRKTYYLACETRRSREEWFSWMGYLVRQEDANFTLTKIQVDDHKLVNNETYDKIPLLKWSVLNRLVACPVEEFVVLAYFDPKFQTSLQRKLMAKNFEEVYTWTNGLTEKSRREIHYILPKQKSKHFSSVVPRTRVQEKFMIEKYEPGVGVYITSSIQLLDIPYGKLLRCLVRTVISSWKGSRSRICISMEIDTKSTDAAVYEYFESLMRAFMLQYYEDTWIPLCSKAVKYTVEKRRKKDDGMKVVTPLGLDYVKLK